LWFFEVKRKTILCHIDGQDRPIAYASGTLSQTEKNYAQIERETLSIVFGVIKFHQFLYGRNFTLITDHKPLLAFWAQGLQFPHLLLQGWKGGHWYSLPMIM
jgi:hypothetical protein